MLPEHEILDILHAHHGGWRALIEAKQELPRKYSLEKLYEARGEPYETLRRLTDEEFIEMLRKIVDIDRFNYVTTQQAAEIENLVWRYEVSPIKRVHPIVPNTVRQQTRAKKIQQLSAEQQISQFGGEIPGVNFYYVLDVLKVQLGRWPYKRRLLSKPPAKRGRPAKHGKTEKNRAEIS
jgi:hypothetical protein